MHRKIMGLVRGDKRQVDHINHDTLDNRRENLRIVSRRQNHENRQDQSKHGPGIVFNPRLKSKPFRVQTKIDGRKHHIGCFQTSNEAKAARIKYLEQFV